MSSKQRLIMTLAAVVLLVAPGLAAQLAADAPVEAPPQTTATSADGKPNPNDFVMSEPVGEALRFTTDGLTESIGEYNGLLSLSKPIFGLGPLNYDSSIEGIHPLKDVVANLGAQSGFGLGWRLHFGRLVTQEFGPGASGWQANYPYAFEYGDGARARWACLGGNASCTSGLLSDFSRIETLNGGGYRVTTTSGTRYTLTYQVVGIRNTWPHPWGGGAEGWYATRVEDVNGNFTAIEYYGSSSPNANLHSPLPRVVTTGRATTSGDHVSGRVCFYLEGDGALDQIPADRLDVTSSHYRIGKIRGPGPEGTLDAMSSGWLTYSLSYQVVQQDDGFFEEMAQLTGIHLEDTFDTLALSYYGLGEDGGFGRLKGVSYPSGGTATYEYSSFYMVIGGWSGYHVYDNDRYSYQPAAVYHRTVFDPASETTREWYLDYDHARYYATDGEDQMLQKNTIWVVANGADPGSRTESWFEPMQYVGRPASGKTGMLRHRKVYASEYGETAIREEHAYGAVFRVGPLKDNALQQVFAAFPGARQVSFTDGSEAAHYVESYRDHALKGVKDAFLLYRMGVNGGTDYDSYGNRPFVEKRQASSVAFQYASGWCWSKWMFYITFGADPPPPVTCDQDTVTIVGGGETTYQKDSYQYVIDTDPRGGQYEAAGLTRLLSRAETRDISAKLLAASETYYDNDPRRPVEGITEGIGDRSQALRGRPSVSVQVNVIDATQSPVVSRVYAIAATSDQPAGALIEEAVKVRSGEYRRTRMSYERGSSCVSPTSPTKSSFIKADGSEVPISTAEYNCVGAARWSEDENGQRTSFFYDSRGRLRKEIQPGDTEASPTTEYVYDDAGPSQGWKPRSMETRKTSDDVAYHSSCVFYDGLGRVFHAQHLQSNGSDAGKVVATSTRFFRGSQAPEEQTRPYVSAASTDPAVYAAAAFSGPRTVTVRDGLGRVLSVQEKSGATVVRKVDHEYGDTSSSLALLQEAVIDQNGRRTVTTHDSWGRVTQVTLPDGKEVIFRYDSAGRLKTTVHPDKRETTQDYDGLGRLSSRTSPGTGTETTEYDLTGAVTKRRSNGVVAKLYDERGRIQREVLELGRLKLPMAQYVYDAHPDGTRIVNQANPKGRLTQVLFGDRTLNNSYEYGYDAKGRVIEQVTKLFDLDAKKLETAYDRQGLVRRTRYQPGSSDELDLEFTYDQNMRPRQLLDRRTASACESGSRVLASYTYDVAGDVLREEWLPCPGSRLQGIDHSRDEFGRLVRVNDPSLSQAADPGHDANDIFGLKLGYEEVFKGSTPQRNGNVSWMQWRTLGNTQAAYVFTYDARDQLEKANFWEKIAGGTIWIDPANRKFDVDYSYDELGNIETQQRRDAAGALSDLSYAYEPANGRRLQSLTGSINAAFGYDAAGNLSFNGRWPGANQLVYDHRNLLTNVTIPNQYRLYLIYDASGARVRKGVLPYDPVQQNYFVGDVFHYLPQAVYKNKQLAYWDVAGKARIVPPGSPFGAAGLAFHMKDHLGSVRATLREDGTILETTDYYPSGMEMPVRSRNGVSRELSQFTGQLRDREFPTTVDYFKARYYDPEIGRFFSADALQDLHPSFTPYAYVRNNPLRYTDPTGNSDYEERLKREEEERRRNEEIRRQEELRKLLESLSATAAADATKTQPGTLKVDPQIVAAPGKPTAEAGSSTPWMDVALTEQGVGEAKGADKNTERIVEYHGTTSLKATTDETPWCASFCNWTLSQDGKTGTGSAAASSFLAYGDTLSTPRYGAITIIQSKSAAGNKATGSASGYHVAFFVSATENRIRLFGGNQSDSVKFSNFKLSSYDVVGYRWPK
jgi:uncharacterized protein (TIGR02594 family)